MTDADNLKQTRATDRAKIADILRQTAEAGGAKVEITAEWPSAASRDTLVQIWLDGVSASIIFGATNTDGFCVAWHVTLDCPKRLSPSFGHAAGGPVNMFHRRKCTTFHDTLSDATRRISAALACIADGTGTEESDA